MFKSELNLIAIEDRPDLWRFGLPLIWDDIIVPAGFITDLASIPHIIDWMPNLDTMGLSRRPAALHDWLYARQMGKTYADDLLHKALLAEGMSWQGANEYFYAVHWFGASSYVEDGAKLTQANFYTPADFEAWVAVDSI